MSEQSLPKSVQRMVALTNGEKVTCPACNIGTLRIVDDGAVFVRCDYCDYIIVGSRKKKEKTKEKGIKRFVAAY